MRHVCLVIVDRANWGRISPVARAIQQSPNLRLSIVCAGSTVLSRFACPADDIEQAGFPVVERLWHEIEGSNLLTMARSGGLAQMEFAASFERMKPDLVVLIGDRYQALAAAVAASTMNIPILHYQGGEVSDSADDKYRHMISKAADWHWPATQLAADNLVRMGELPERIVGVGCPASDVAATIKPRPELANSLLCVYHPTTTRFGTEREQAAQLMAALSEIEIPTLMLWPNVDGGSSELMKVLRSFRAEKKPDWLTFHTNFSPDEYLTILASVACAVGNSSSFVRDSSYFGTPVVLVGPRQDGRESAENVVRVPAEAGQIAAAVRSQVRHGRFKKSTLFGDGAVAERSVEVIETLDLSQRKRLCFSEAVCAS